jgi:hypothetical protein
MIVLNGMVGAALLMGALRYWEKNTISPARAPSSWSSPRSPCSP